MSNTQGAELTVRELLQKRDVNDGDTQRADGRIYLAVVDSQKNAKIVEWVEIRSERTDAQEFKHTCLSAASISCMAFSSLSTNCCRTLMIEDFITNLPPLS